MRIYISGPITGTAHYALKFAAAAHRLHEAGHVPANPVLLPAPAPREGDDEWRAWMRATTRLLTDCDGVALLPGWRDSRGWRCPDTPYATLDRDCLGHDCQMEHKITAALAAAGVPVKEQQ